MELPNIFPAMPEIFLAVAAMIYVLHGPELVRHHFPGFAVVFGQ